MPVHQPIIVNFILTFFSKHISGLHTAFWPRDALLSETAWHQCTQRLFEDVRAHYLWHLKPVIGDSAVCCSLSSHIFVSSPTSHRPSWYQFIYCFVNRELLGVLSSLSKAISQKPSKQAPNPQPSDLKSGTFTVRLRAHSLV